MPRNSAVKKVKINACRNATNSSSRLNAVTPSTLPIVWAFLIGGLLGLPAELGDAQTV